MSPANPIVSLLLGLASIVALAGTTTEDVALLQRDWAEIKYRTVPGEQEKKFERLAAEADQTLSRHRDSPEALIWHGIIVASYAGAKGGLGALPLAKAARRDFEESIRIDPDALSGSAYTSLGSLYYQVPGWPIGFGDEKKARDYLQRGLSVNPDGIDPNFFYADFLYRNGDLDGAEQYLRKAQQAPPRPGREVADAGRQKEIKALLQKVMQQRR